MARRTALLMFFFFTLVYTLTNSFRPTVQMPDEEYVLIVASNMVSGRPLHLPDHVPVYSGAIDIGANGKRYSAYQIGSSLLYAPFYFVTKQLIRFNQPYSKARFGGNRNDYDTWLERETRRWLYFVPALFAALSCGVFLLFSARLGYSPNTGIILTLLYGLGTMVWPYSKYLLTESFHNLLLLGSIYLLYAQRQEGRMDAKSMLGAGSCFGFLLSIRVMFAALLPILALYWYFRNRERRLIAPFLGFAIPAVLLFVPQLIYDYVRFNNALSLGYGGASFSTPLYVGLFGYLVSPGKGFFFYAPIALLFFFGIHRFFERSRQEAILILIVLAVIPVKYAGWWVWSGDPCWGPRFLLVLTPFLMLPAGEVIESVLKKDMLWKRGVVALLFSVSFAIQCLAISAHYLHYLNYVRQSGTLIPPSRLSASRATQDGPFPIRDRYIETEFNPEFSPILGQWWVVKHLMTGSPEPAHTVPWKGLGYSQLHEGVELKASWDLWIINAFKGGFEWVRIKIYLAAIALLIVLSIVAQDLFQTFLLPRKKDELNW